MGTPMSKLLSGDVVRLEELNAGDHIYAYRRYGLYMHHGIYVGGGHVIHFTRTGVDKTCLDCFRREGKKLHFLHSYAYGRPVLEYWLTRSGTCTTLPNTKSPEEVVNKAWELHEGNNFGKYNLFSNNCEHFATFCKTGVLASTQTALINAFELKAKGVKDWAIKILQGLKAQVMAMGQVSPCTYDWDSFIENHLSLVTEKCPAWRTCGGS